MAKDEVWCKATAQLESSKARAVAAAKKSAKRKLEDSGYKPISSSLKTISTENPLQDFWSATVEMKGVR